jgi:tRNA uridine 5-carboxymethylaminomethyl modification enzyme
MKRRSNKKYDIIVIGGGHAGCEAAYVAAKLTEYVLLMTGSIDALARMSCNPAVGGLAKSQLVKEIDGLGGLIGEIADRAGVQFRLLNRSKGPAVRSTRAQCDRKRYETEMKKRLAAVENLDIIEEMAVDIIVENGSVCGILDSSRNVYHCSAAIITAGTFLNGLIHIGLESTPAGRAGEPPALGLTENLQKFGIESGRLKTGTPPRLDGKSIDFDRCKRQEGDNPPPFFSHRSRVELPRQLPCYLTYTNDRTHRILETGLDRSPLFTGIIKGTGPRYCPSIEDKIVRFRDKERHQLFIEPEGWDTDECYLNGFASSLPAEVQFEALKTIPGLEEVKMNKPGYAIEYDYFPPSQIKPNLESKIVGNLFFAGQVNGTSGYEEAAAQGIMAGINAVLNLRGESPFILKRSDAYIGVLIDDITTREISEPYRMFTSRAEYRLILREDNARQRMSRFATRYGLISKEEKAEIEEQTRIIREEIEKLNRRFVFPASIRRVDQVKEIKDRKLSLAEALRIPGVTESDIVPASPDFASLPAETRYKIEIEVKYRGYIERQLREIEKAAKFEETVLPADLRYAEIKGLKREAAEKMDRFQPYTLGQASRIAGVSPGDISVLLVYMKKIYARG